MEESKAFSRKRRLKVEKISIDELFEYWSQITNQSFDSRLQLFFDNRHGTLARRHSAKIAGWRCTRSGSYLLMRYHLGRGGSGFRGEGGRRRGLHGGGRGYGSEESNKGEYAGRGGGKGYQNRHEQGQSHKSEYGGRGDGREYLNHYEQRDSNNSEYGGSSGGRGYQNRQDGYQRSDQTRYIFGRVN